MTKIIINFLFDDIWMIDKIHRYNSQLLQNISSAGGN